MIKPRVDKLLDHADSHYAAVVVSAKRARQINSYFHNLGEGGFGEYPPPIVPTNAARTYLSMSLEELAEGKLKYESRAWVRVCPRRGLALKPGHGSTTSRRQRRHRRLQGPGAGPA